MLNRYSITADRKDLNVILASTLGILFEGYDFTIYMLLSSVISQVFFDVSNLTTLVYTFAVFATGYLIRPLGGIIMGHFGDRFGRKNVFLFSMFLMMIPTILIGCIPDYDHIGILAPILLLSFRCIQGIAYGGEIAASITFVYEHVDRRIRSRALSIMYAGGNIGFLLATLISWLITKYYHDYMLYTYAWRWAFYFGGLVGAVGFYFRMKITETPVFLMLEKESCLARVPLAELLSSCLFLTIGCFILCLPFSINYAVLFTLMPTLLTAFFNIDLNVGLGILLFAHALLIICIAGAGWVVDLFMLNVKKVYLYSVFVMAFAIIPLFNLFEPDNISRIYLFYPVFAVSMGFVFACFPSIISGLFPAKIRFSGVALSYNLSMAVGSGLAPLMSTMLVAKLGTPVAPAYLVIFTAIVGAIPLIIFLVKGDRQKVLPEENDELIRKISSLPGMADIVHERKNELKNRK